MRPAAKGWKGQSILVNRGLTCEGSPARTIGLMPAFGHHALEIVRAASRLAGMAKKRWRDADLERMTLSEVRALRAAMNDSFDALEACLSGGEGAEATHVVDAETAADNARIYGMSGITALAIVEEAGELAEPLHALALGTPDPLDAHRSIKDEAADVRTWLHLIDTAHGIDPVSTTQDKWTRSLERLGATAQKALEPRRLDQDQVNASMAALAASTKGVSKR